jgi:membrane dipeptidase
MRGVLGENLMRIMDKVDAVSEQLMRERRPSSAIWEKRQDLPALKWGGGGANNVYWPKDVREAVEAMQIRHDEL